MRMTYCRCIHVDVTGSAQKRDQRSGRWSQYIRVLSLDSEDPSKQTTYNIFFPTYDLCAARTQTTLFESDRYHASGHNVCSKPSSIMMKQALWFIFNLFSILQQYLFSALCYKYNITAYCI
jgi:hypothetical protein